MSRRPAGKKSRHRTEGFLREKNPAENPHAGFSSTATCRADSFRGKHENVECKSSTCWPTHTRLVSLASHTTPNQGTGVHGSRETLLAPADHPVALPVTHGAQADTSFVAWYKSNSACRVAADTAAIDGPTNGAITNTTTVSMRSAAQSK
jgi:hypothetical protein